MIKKWWLPFSNRTQIQKGFYDDTAVAFLDENLKPVAQR